MQKDSKNGDIARVSRFLKAGTVLVPKPEWFDFYRDRMNNWTEYVVTDKDEAANATIGERWMIKPNCGQRIRINAVNNYDTRNT